HIRIASCKESASSWPNDNNEQPTKTNLAVGHEMVKASPLMRSSRHQRRSRRSYSLGGPPLLVNGANTSIGTGKNVVVLCSLEISRMVCRKRSCSAIGSWLIIAPATDHLFRGLKFALGVDDFGAALALGFGLLRHRALHRVGQRCVFQFDGCNFDDCRSRTTSGSESPLWIHYR